MVLHNSELARIRKCYLFRTIWLLYLLDTDMIFCRECVGASVGEPQILQTIGLSEELVTHSLTFLNSPILDSSVSFQISFYLNSTYIPWSTSSSVWFYPCSMPFQEQNLRLQYERPNNSQTGQHLKLGSIFLPCNIKKIGLPTKKKMLFVSVDDFQSAEHFYMLWIFHRPATNIINR